MQRKKLDPLIHMCGAGPQDEHSTVRRCTMVTFVKNVVFTVTKNAGTTMLATTRGCLTSATAPVPALFSATYVLVVVAVRPSSVARPNPAARSSRSAGLHL